MVIEGGKKFCLLTTGRSGSTSLMEALEPYEDIALPKKQIDCADNELLRPRDFARHMQDYAALCGEAVEGQEGLIDAFYRYNAAAPCAGFKSMPHRHENYEAFISRPDIRFITLIREDVASTVASFMLAIYRGTWRRHGNLPAQRWIFRQEDAPQAQSILLRLRENLRNLQRVPNAIRLSYEQLCEKDFDSPELAQLFGRPIHIKNPAPPISGAAYTDNWEGFLEAIENPGEV